MGLDAWRLYETIRLTRKPVECTTTLVVERLLGLVGLFAVILLFMPFAGRITQGQSFGELVAAIKIPIAATLVFGVLVLLQPEWFRGLLRLIPNGRLRNFAQQRHRLRDRVLATARLPAPRPARSPSSGSSRRRSCTSRTRWRSPPRTCT